MFNHYYQLVKVFDYVYIEDIVLFIDSKLQRINKLSKKEATRITVENNDLEDINLVEKAFYNSHYSLYGTKVQHII